ncbi:MAG: hypothetical protein QOG82_2924 [Actinomycetota bacterium]|nr:hypothetical protein [Actinomycetota bacterium]
MFTRSKPQPRRRPGTGGPVATVDRRVTDAGAQAARDLAARLTRRPSSATATATRPPATRPLVPANRQPRRAPNARPGPAARRPAPTDAAGPAARRPAPTDAHAGPPPRQTGPSPRPAASR